MTKPLSKNVARLRNAFLRLSDELMRAVSAACPGPHLPRDHYDGRPSWCDACGRDRFGFLHDDPGATGELQSADELERRHRRLLERKQGLEVEIVATEDRLRAAGRWGRVGRPRTPPTHTEAEAREAHQRWNAGERTPWVEAGHRQYQREQRRRSYAAAREAARKAEA